MLLGRKILNLRLDRGLSQQELARVSGGALDKRRDESTKSFRFEHYF